MRKPLTQATFALLAVLAVSTVPAEPPVERTLVVAVADADQDRVLVRWRTLEGTQRYRYYDVLRRDAEGEEFFLLNPEPIGPLADAASIQAVFTAPGRADALAWIQETLGPEYANELLRLQGSDPPREAAAKLTFLPDQNYGAALALGLGWLDETVVDGETYVYEVWGVDELGYPAERLGRASATAGSPWALSAPLSMDCVEPGDQRADGAAFLRWNEMPGEERYIFGYEVYRKPCGPDPEQCPAGMTPQDPDAVRANQFPVLPAAPGHVKAGRTLFETHCSTGICHAGGRDELKGKTLEDFRRLQHSNVTAPGLVFCHDTVDLNALSPDTLAKVFDYVQEFRFRDDGDDTPLDPVSPGCYCYMTVARDLLGQIGAPSAPLECEVKDLIPPEVPALIRSDRVTVGDHEVCEISWQRNDDTEDGTVEYELLRRTGSVPRNAYLYVDGVETRIVDTIPQPVGAPGDRVIYTDSGITYADATKLYFYAARATDAAGNVSPISGWVPCVPRDIAAPAAPTAVDTLCCENYSPDLRGCENHVDDDWVAAGGDPVVIADPAICPPRFVYDLPGDAFRVRVYRSFDGETWFQGQDIEPEPCEDQPQHFCFTPVFQPTLDQKISYRLKSFDKSGNLSVDSTEFYAIFKGWHPPPAPQIYQVLGMPSDDPPMPNRVVIKFRSLRPSALLGFALYVRPSPPTSPGPYQYVWVGKGEFVKALPDDNFANGTPDPTDPEQWILSPAARTLGHYLPLGDGEPEYLLYDEIWDTYEMAVDIGDTDNVVLQLTAIGWTGLEGPYGGKSWDGWVTGDDKLDWPRFRDVVYFPLNGPAPDTRVSLTQLHDVSIHLEWSPDPAGCDGQHPGESMQPFVVFRRRGHSPNWQQISPPFICRALQGTDPLEFVDYDVEDGMYYRYAVVQLDDRGEFTWLRTSDPICFSVTEPCEGPAPE